MNTNTFTPKLRRPIFDALIIALAVLGAVILFISWRWVPERLALWLIVGAVIYTGFGIPRWQGWAERSRRAGDAQNREHKKWGFHGRDREGPWLNYIDFPLIHDMPETTGKYFYSEWLIVHDGIVVVNPGPSTVDPDNRTVSYDFSRSRTYAWDGCTPKRWFFWLTLFGTPDGREVIEPVHYQLDGQKTPGTKFWQRAHHASLVHDAFYQYLDTVPVAKSDVDGQFHRMLLCSGFNPKIASLYHFAVKHFGATDVKTTAPAQQPPFRLINPPPFLAPRSAPTPLAQSTTKNPRTRKPKTP